MAGSILAPIGGLLTWDTVVSETWTNAVNVTSHPIELGLDVTDHAQILPTSWTVVGVIKETNELALPPLGRVQFAVNFLERAQGQLLTVESVRFGTRTNVLLRDVTFPAEAAEKVVFTCRFQQVVLATAVAVIIPPTIPPVAEAVGAATEQDVGVQPPIPAELSADDQSLLAQLADTLGGLAGGG